MNTEYRPLETTMNSYSRIEEQVYHDFLNFGYTAAVAEAIAKSLTQYVLGYMKDADVTRAIMKAGASEDVAGSVLDGFRVAKKNASPGSLTVKPGRVAAAAHG